MLSFLLVTLTLVSSPPVNGQAASGVPLSSLKAPCKLELHETDYAGFANEALWVDCGCGRVRVVSPNNLTGLVTITDRSAALEFVRLLTGPESAAYAELGGIVELMPDNGAVHPTFNMVTQEKFVKFLMRPTIDELSDVLGKWFVVVRDFVLPSNQVVRIKEMVGTQGQYRQISRTTLLDNALKLDVMYLGNN